MNKELKHANRKTLGWNDIDEVKVKELAKTYGWEPDYYFRDRNMMISAEDTANMADALERTIEDISSKPVRTPEEKDIIKIKCPNGIMLDGLPLGYYDDWDAISYWGGQEARIGEFIEFLRLGSYRTD